jgi:dihydrofolate synthase / folylpolyglutamate synthase
MADIELSYQAALDYLYSFVDYSLTRSFQFTPEKFNLGRMVDLLRLMGDPHKQYPVIHVAGTKGKGSTSAMIASVLQASGYQVGFYTSPHLQDYTERIQVNGVAISHEELVDLVEQVKPLVAQVKELTTFEITTAISFLYFAQKKCAAAVIEVGLGGRLDATNVVDPLVSVITSLSMDHMHVLGDTLTKIAFEKAGIIKPGRPVVLSQQREDALAVVVQVAQERGCELVQVGQDFRFSPGEHDLQGQSFVVWRAEDQAQMDHLLESEQAIGANGWKPEKLCVPLLGYHQVQNAVTAYAALKVADQNGLMVSDSAIREGFAQVSWPARFEILQNDPMLIVDSAHNRDSALKLRATLDDYLPGKPVILIFGASEDKDVHGMFEELLPRVRRVVATRSEHPRALEVEQIVNLAHQFGRPAQAQVPVEKALEKAFELAKKENAVILAAGSLFIAAAVRAAWEAGVR